MSENNKFYSCYFISKTTGIDHEINRYNYSLYNVYYLLITSEQDVYKYAHLVQLI